MDDLMQAGGSMYGSTRDGTPAGRRRSPPLTRRPNVERRPEGERP